MNNYMPTKLCNPEDMDKVLEIWNLPKLNQEEKENLNRPIVSKEVESGGKKKTPKKRKAQDQMSSLVNFTKHL